MAISTPPRAPRFRGASLFLVLSFLLLGSLCFAAGEPVAAHRGGLPASPPVDGGERHRPLPDFDIQAARGTVLPALPELTADEAANDLPAGSRVRLSALTRRASRVAHASASLTLPSTASALEVAKRFLADQPRLFGLGRGEVQALEPTRNYTTPGLGVTHLTVAQQYRGIPVFQAEMVINVDRGGRLLTAAGELVPRLEGTINTVAPTLSAAEALAIAARSVGVVLERPPVQQGAPVGPRRRVTFAAGETFPLPINAELSYFQVAPGRTHLAWDLTIFQHHVPDVYHILVDAVTGAVLFRKNYTQYAQGLVYLGDAPQDGTPYLGVEPPVTQRVLRPFDGGMFFNLTDPHFDWWAGAAQTTTESNYVRAGLNRDGPAFPDLTTQPTLVNAPTGNFSFPLDLSQPPSAWPEAAVTNLFYWNNVCHDVWYQFGFTETAGNFQRTNFGLGGGEGDPVIALAQHCADCNPPERNNAFMATLPDGFPAWMAMFEFDYTNPLRDSDLDNATIFHEWCHGLTNRLVGNANGLNGFQSGAMGEGWSDFCALVMLAQPTDDIHGVYPMFGWTSIGEYAAGDRLQPYSSNPAVFTRTYGEINSLSPSVHDAGEIMANTMWQLYVKLVERFGFTEGRNRAMQLFVDGLKLSPSNPTFLDYRDAVLLADRERYRGAELAEIWAVFASRGMGLSASTTDSGDINPVEAFDVPVNLYAISGRVSVKGIGVGGVQVTATDPTLVTMQNPTGIAATELTAADGTYTLAGLRSGSLRVSAAFPNFEFAPPAMIVAVPPFAEDAHFVGQQVAPIPGPAGLTAAALSSRQIRLDWQDGFNDETVFEIERKDPGGAFSRIAAVGPNTTSYFDGEREPNHTHVYRVRAILPYAVTEYSNEASALTLPEAPSALTARVVSDTQIDLSWTPAEGGQESFRLERVVGGSIQTGSGLTTKVVAGDQVTYSDTGLTAHTTYAYRIRALNGTGESPVSREAGGTTLRPKPAMPGGLNVATVSSGSLRLTWTDQSDSETFFRVERSIDSGGTWPVSRSVTGVAGTGTEVELVENGLSANTRYTFRLLAVNVNHASDPTAAVSRLTAPARPSGLVVSNQGSASVELDWNDNSPQPSGFRVERRTSDGMYGLLDTVAAGTSAYTDTAVLANTRYFYRVQAENADATSDYSDEAAVTTPPDAPEPPVGLGLQVLSSREIRLTWTDQSSLEQLFKVERRVVGDGAGFRQIATVAAVSGTGSAVVYADAGLVPATHYTYRVRAYNAGGDSAYTGEETARTLPNRPGVPSGLAVRVVSQNELQLTWTDGSSDENGFKIERSLDGTEFAQIDTAPANATTYASSGLAPNTPYYFRVRATNDGGDSNYSNVASGTTWPEVPQAPTGLSAQVSPAGVRLTWMDRSDNETGFRVERSTDGDTFSLLVLLGVDAASHTDQSVAPNTTYSYQVRSVNTGGRSEPSNQVEVQTPPPPPTAPSALTVAVVSSSELTLSWEDNSNNETGFEIERREGGGAFVRVETRAAQSTSYADTGLASNTEYSYRVRSVNDGGSSAYTSTVSRYTLPSSPGGLSASAEGQNRIDLAWSDASARPSAFKVERATGMSANWTEIAVTPVGATGYQDTGLPVSTHYRYRVRATNASGDSPYSNEVSLQTLPLPPAAPSDLRVHVGGQFTLTLKWTDRSANELGFEVERSEDGGDSFVLFRTLGVNSDSVIVEGLAPATLYHFRVRAFNEGGHSGYSSPLRATTLPLAPEAPSGLAVSRAAGEQPSPGALAPGATALVLTWTDNSSTESGFLIERSMDGGESFASVGMVDADATSYTDGGLTAATPYTYRILAVNDGGASEPSETATLRTLPAPPSAPTSLAVIALTAGKVQLSWSDNSSDETSFRVDRRISAGAFAPLATVDPDSESYADENVTAGVTYRYRVAAVNGGGLSSYVEGQVTLPLGLLSLTLTADTVRGGKTVRGVVALSGPAPRGGAVIVIGSSDRAARVAKKVRIPAGRTSANFAIRTVRPRESVEVTISGTYGGVIRSATLNVVR